MIESKQVTIKVQEDPYYETLMRTAKMDELAAMLRLQKAYDDVRHPYENLVGLTRDLEGQQGLVEKLAGELRDKP